jgi:hypothetical protein
VSIDLPFACSCIWCEHRENLSIDAESAFSRLCGKESISSALVNKFVGNAWYTDYKNGIDRLQPLRTKRNRKHFLQPHRLSIITYPSIRVRRFSFHSGYRKTRTTPLFT